MKLSKQLAKAQTLANDWHEAGRTQFEYSFSNLNYDNYYPKRVINKRKYINLDEGNSGSFMIDKNDGTIYRIKGYGIPNKSKVCGNLSTITGEELNKLRQW